jgi:hypothetical protein
MHYRFAQKQPIQATREHRHTAAAAMITMATFSVVHKKQQNKTKAKFIIEDTKKRSIETFWHFCCFAPFTINLPYEFAKWDANPIDSVTCE